MSYVKPLPLGLCELTYKGQALEITVTGASVHETEHKVDIKTAKTGAGVSDKILIGRDVWVECNVAFKGLETLKLLKRTSAEGTSLGVGISDLGTALSETAGELKLHPKTLGTKTDGDLTIWLAALEVEDDGIEMGQDNMDKGIKVKFIAIPDFTKTDDKVYGQWGTGVGV